MSSLNNTLIWSGGILIEGDIITLSHGLSISDRHLIDQATDTRHHLHPLAELALIQLCSQELEVEKWKENITRLGISSSQIRDILSFLSIIGGLEVQRDLRKKVQMTIQTISLGLLGKSFINIATRSPATLLGISKAVFQAMNLVWITSLITVTLIYFSGSSILSPSYLLFFLTSLYISVVIHELGHAILLSLSTSHLCTLRRGMRIAILHPPLSQKKEALVALMGPLLGITSSALMFLIFHHSVRSTLTLPTTVTLIILHLLSFLPWYGDGRALFTLFKTQSHAS